MCREVTYVHLDLTEIGSNVAAVGALVDHTFGKQKGLGMGGFWDKSSKAKCLQPGQIYMYCFVGNLICDRYFMLPTGVYKACSRMTSFTAPIKIRTGHKQQDVLCILKSVYMAVFVSTHWTFQCVLLCLAVVNVRLPYYTADSRAIYWQECFEQLLACWEILDELLNPASVRYSVTFWLERNAWCVAHAMCR